MLVGVHHNLPSKSSGRAMEGLGSKVREGDQRGHRRAEQTTIPFLTPALRAGATRGSWSHLGQLIPFGAIPVQTKDCTTYSGIKYWMGWGGLGFRVKKCEKAGVCVSGEDDAGWVLLHHSADPGLPPSRADISQFTVYIRISDGLSKNALEYCKVSKSSSLHSALIYFEDTSSSLTMGEGWERRQGHKEEEGKGDSKGRERWPDTQTALAPSEQIPAVGRADQTV